MYHFRRCWKMPVANLKVFSRVLVVFVSLAFMVGAVATLTGALTGIVSLVVPGLGVGWAALLLTSNPSVPSGASGATNAGKVVTLDPYATIPAAIDPLAPWQEAVANLKGQHAAGVITSLEFIEQMERVDVQYRPLAILEESPPAEKVTDGTGDEVAQMVREIKATYIPSMAAKRRQAVKEANEYLKAAAKWPGDSKERDWMVDKAKACVRPYLSDVEAIYTGTTDAPVQYVNTLV
jgi:hypothetical protein